MWCDKTFPEEMLHTGLFTPKMESGTDQCTNPNKVQLGKPVSFLEVTDRHLDELLLTGAEMTQNRCIHYQGPLPPW